MRELKRIERITFKLGLLWVKYPDQRLFQLLSNYTRLGLRGSELGNIRDPFNYEDEDIEKDLDKAIKDVYGKKEMKEKGMNEQELKNFLNDGMNVYLDGETKKIIKGAF